MIEVLADDWTQSASEERANGSNERVRVLHVINGEHYAGAERAQDLMALQLPKLGYDVTFVCLKRGRFAEMRRSLRTPLRTLPMRGRFDLRPVRAIVRMIREGKYQLVHTHTPRSALVGGLAAAWARIPLVHHVQSPAGQDSTIHWRNSINSLVERLSLSHVAAVIPVSESMAHYVQQCGIRGPHFSIVPNGVPAQPELHFRQRPDGIWTIGIVALFRPRKGLDVLLSAFAKLRTAGYPVRLRAVGRFETAEYEAEIMDRVQSLGIADAIDWRGFRRDVHAELAAMDLFALPSLFGEGLPFVLLEAMSAGVPVVSTSVEGIPEAIRDGQDGLIVPPGNADALANAIRRLIDGEVDWQALRTSAFHRQSVRYTDVTMASGVAAVYESVLSDCRAIGTNR